MIDARVAAGMTRQHATNGLVYQGRDFLLCDKPDKIAWLVGQFSKGRKGMGEDGKEKGCLAHGFKLLRDRVGKHFLVVVTEEAEEQLSPEQAANSTVASVDTGVKVLATVTGPGGESVECAVDCGRVVSEFAARSQWLKKKMEGAKQARTKENEDLRMLQVSQPGATRCQLPYFHPGKSAFSRQRRLEHRLAAHSLKQQRWMKCIHYWVINLLFAQYDILLWPWLRTQQMISRKGVLAKGTKALCKAQSHYQFMRRLHDKAQITPDKAVLFVAEPGTSKTCGVCGAINVFLSSLGLFDCNPERGGCGNCVLRDWQGAANNGVAGALHVNPSQGCASSLVLLRSPVLTRASLPTLQPPRAARPRAGAAALEEQNKGAR